MAVENYGVDARLVDSIASTPVSTNTNIIFIGASKSGVLNKPVLVTSLSDYATKLGGVPGDGYNLTEAAIAAFSVAGIDKCYMIPVSNNNNTIVSDYTGDVALETGVYAIEALLRNQPFAVNIICAPNITISSIIEALNTIAQKADGHWMSYVLYDIPVGVNQYNQSKIVQPAAVVADKQLNSERASAVWGRVLTSGGYAISGAAVRACLMAKSDATYGAPVRCGGNLAVQNVQGCCDEIANSATYYSAPTTLSSTPIALRLEYGKDYYDTMPWSDDVDYSVSIENVYVVETSDHLVGIVSSLELSNVIVELTVSSKSNVLLTLRESDATQLSADGICTFINSGGGNWRTWGDHTSAFTSGSVSDERARFENYMRVQMMIANRFQMKYRDIIDDPMTLQMRNDIINEELDYLNSLVAIGALIGRPAVEFVAADNSTDQIAQGYFTWSISTTETPPAKYLLAKVAYTQAGLDVYTQEG